MRYLLNSVTFLRLSLFSCVSLRVKDIVGAKSEGEVKTHDVLFKCVVSMASFASPGMW